MLFFSVYDGFVSTSPAHYALKPSVLHATVTQLGEGANTVITTKAFMKGLLKALATAHTNSFKNPYGIDLDISYITDQIIVCSCPTVATGKSFYHNSLPDLVNYLNIQHGDNWHIWNLRSEMDQHAYDVKDPLLSNHITYMPWRDHECPTFEHLRSSLSSIERYLSSKDNKRVAVIHCKLGKGRSGLICIGLLISTLGYTHTEAQNLFTEKRMRPGFGEGVSILSQKRYGVYVERSKVHAYNPYKRRAKIHCIRLFDDFYDSSRASSITVRLAPIRAGDCSKSPENPRSIDFHTGYRTTSNESSLSLFYAPLHPLCSVPLDIKIVVEKVACSALPIKCSHAFTCFNLFWEDLIHKEENEQSGANFSRFEWGSFDGFKGSSKKGSKTFNKLELEWEFV